MTKSRAGPDDQNPPAGGPGEEGPSPELVEQLRQFEARVDEAVRLIGELRQQKRGLEARLEEASRARAEAAQRIDALIDKIDGLL
jgi:chromosome segregation ATPase